MYGFRTLSYSDTIEGLNKLSKTGILKTGSRFDWDVYPSFFDSVLYKWVYMRSMSEK